MLFFQMPLIPELLLMAFDLESMDQLAETIKNNKPTAEDVEAYKYNFSSKGKNNKPTAEDVEAYKYNFSSKGKNNKPTAEDIEAYKYNFSSKGKNNKPTTEDVEAYKYNFSSKGINSVCWVIFFSCFCCCLLTFFKIIFLKKIFQEQYRSVKWFGYRSGLTFCRS